MRSFEDFELSGENALHALTALLTARRAALRHRIYIAFSVLDEGEYVLDLDASPPLRQGFDENADLIVASTRRTLSDLFLGRLDPSDLDPEHVFLWGGRRETLLEIANVLRSGSSLFRAHLSSLERSHP
jgi:hypothetical protein